MVVVSLYSESSLTQTDASICSLHSIDKYLYVCLEFSLFGEYLLRRALLEPPAPFFGSFHKEEPYFLELHRTPGLCPLDELHEPALGTHTDLAHSHLTLRVQIEVSFHLEGVPTSLYVLALDLFFLHSLAYQYCNWREFCKDL